MKDISDSNFKIIEIYPHIYVYKNLFKDIKNTYDILKDSYENQGNGLLNYWSEWSTFGEYLSPPISDEKHPHRDTVKKTQNVDLITTSSLIEEQHKSLMLEVLNIFHLVTEDYAKKNSINIDTETILKDQDQKSVRLWMATGPSICRYKNADSDDPVAMTYHTDYIREQGERPGYKFVITALAYFNDDYEGGEIDFVIDKKLVKYKPEAGDYLVFPSGHPDFLTEDGIVYLHGVLPIIKGNKYFSRMYWQKYYEGSQNWHEQEKKYGRDSWLAMQQKIENTYRAQHKQRHIIEDGVRIQ